MSILSKFGLPENIVPPLPPGAKDGSPYSIGLANQQASMNKMSNLLQVTQGGGKITRNRSIKRGRLLKGGAAAPAMITLPPLSVSYPGGGGLQDTYANLVSTAANSTAQSKYDTAWMKASVGGSIKGRRSMKRSKRTRKTRRGIKRSIKRSIKRNKRSNKRSKR
jgi:hypothetical protein